MTLLSTFRRRFRRTLHFLPFSFTSPLHPALSPHYSHADTPTHSLSALAKYCIFPLYTHHSNSSDMGWFGGSSQKEGIEPGQAPTRAQRKLCWENRDAYFACLDQNGIMQADDGELGDKAGVCKDFRKAYEGACGKSWVSPAVRPGIDAASFDRSEASRRFLLLRCL